MLTLRYNEPVFILMLRGRVGCLRQPTLPLSIRINVSSILILHASCRHTCITCASAECTVANSWWWVEELPETCRVLYQNKFGNECVCWFHWKVTNVKIHTWSLATKQHIESFIKTHNNWVSPMYSPVNKWSPVTGSCSPVYTHTDTHSVRLCCG